MSGTSVDGASQEALFQIEGPDEDGCVWACSAEGRDVWCVNLGPAPKVAEVLSTWLDANARRLEADENRKQQAKRMRKAARPKDHREEGGQG